MMQRVLGTVRRRATIPIIALLLVGFAAAPSLDPPITVTTTADTDDIDDSDGTCGDLNGDCSLRAALQTAAANVGMDHIHFDIPDSDPGLDLTTTTATITLGSPLPDIDHAVIINGATDHRYGDVTRPVIAVVAEGSAQAAPVLAFRSPGSVVSDLAVSGGSPAILVNSNDIAVIASSIGGSDGAGIHLLKARGTTIVDSWIGLDWSGDANPNSGDGVIVDRQTRETLIRNNVIGANTGAGISIERSTGSGHSVVGNVISGNGGLAIDLEGDGVTPNDPTDTDAGANNLLNYPVPVSAFSSETETRLALQLPIPSGDYLVEVYTIAEPDQSGHGELDQQIAAVPVAVSELGQTLTVVGPADLNPERYVTAIVTECTDSTCSAYGSTSEAGPALPIEINLAPVLDVGNVVAPAGVAITIPLVGSDPEGATLTWSATGLPPGVVVQGDTLVGTVAEADAGQPYTPEVTATDDVGNVTTTTFTWAITTPTTTTPTTTTPTTDLAPTTIATGSTEPSTPRSTSGTPTTPVATTANPTTTVIATTIASTTTSTTTSDSTTTQPPTTEPRADETPDETPTEPPAELAAVSQSGAQAESALQGAAVALLQRSATAPAAGEAVPSRPSSGIQLILLALVEMAKAANPPIRPLVITFLAACLGWAAVQLATDRVAYMVDPGADDVAVGGYRLSPGAGPFWGRRALSRRSTVNLETPYGKGPVETGSLIELEAKLSGQDHAG